MKMTKAKRLHCQALDSKVSNESLVVCVAVELTEGRHDTDRSELVVGPARVLTDITAPRASSPQFMVESPTERLSPSKDRVLGNTRLVH